MNEIKLLVAVRAAGLFHMGKVMANPSLAPQMLILLFNSPYANENHSSDVPSLVFFGSLSLTIKYAIIKNAVLLETVALERARSQ